MSDSVKFDPISIIPGPITPKPKGGWGEKVAKKAIIKRASKAGLARTPRNAGMDGTLKSIINMLRGGQLALIGLVRTAAQTNTEAATFISKYDNLTHRVKNSSATKLEDICTEMEIGWPRMVSWAMEAAMTTGQHLAAMKAALALPEVVEKSIKFAKQKDGYRDRDFLYRHSGFVPTPAGSSISIVNQIAANAQAKNEGGAAFVPFEQDVIDAIPVKDE